MKGIVIAAFHDKFHFNTVYKEGDVVDFDKDRMQDLFNRKLCKKYKEQDSSPAPLKDEKEKKDENVIPGMEQGGDASDAVDAKAKSEQEAAEKIASATRKKKTI